MPKNSMLTINHIRKPKKGASTSSAGNHAEKNIFPARFFASGE